jgi:GTPase
MKIHQDLYPLFVPSWAVRDGHLKILKRIFNKLGRRFALDYKTFGSVVMYIHVDYFSKDIDCVSEVASDINKALRSIHPIGW